MLKINRVVHIHLELQLLEIQLLEIQLLILLSRQPPPSPWDVIRLETNPRGAPPLDFHHCEEEVENRDGGEDENYEITPSHNISAITGERKYEKGEILGSLTCCREDHPSVSQHVSHPQNTPPRPIPSFSTQTIPSTSVWQYQIYSIWGTLSEQLHWS